MEMPTVAKPYVMPAYTTVKRRTTGRMFTMIETLKRRRGCNDRRGFGKHEAREAGCDAAFV